MLLSHRTGAPRSPGPKAQNGSHSRHHILTVKTQLHPETSGPTLLDGPGTLASGHKGRLQVTGWGGHFWRVVGGPSFTGSKLHTKLLSGCFLRVYLFKVLTTTPTNKDISYVHKLFIKNYMCTQV